MSEDTTEGFGKLAFEWGIPTISYATAAHFIFSGNIEKAIIACFAPVSLSLIYRFFEKLNLRFDKLFEWIIQNIEDTLTRVWWLLTSGFQKKYYKRIIHKHRDYKTQGLKTKGPFALDLEKVFVPLRVSPESSSKISSDMINRTISEDNCRIWDFLTGEKSSWFA